ncbi:Ig-like domain-containing protein [Spirochaetota bacterium]
MKQKQFFAITGIIILFISILFAGCKKSGGVTPFDVEPYSGTVGAEGGNITDPNGASVIIPEGALTGTTTITIKTYGNATTVNKRFGITPFLGAVDFGPDGQQFEKPVTIKFPSSKALTPGDEYALFVYNETSQQWEDTGIKATSTDNGTAFSAEITHFSTYAAFQFPMDTMIKFGEFFDGSNVVTSLGEYEAWFLSTTDIFGYTTKERDGIYDIVREVVGINFAVQYTTNGTPGDHFTTYGTVEPTSDLLTSLSYMLDYSNSQGDQVVYNLVITLYWDVTTVERDEPTIDIIEPIPGKTVSGTVTIGTFTRKTTKVDFYIDDELNGTDGEAPFVYLWNTKLVPDRSYVVKAVASGPGGNVTSESVVVTVKNTEQTREVQFSDTDTDRGEIGGVLTIGKSNVEDNVTHYVLYWGANSKLRLGGQVPIATYTAGDYNSTIYTSISGNTAIPSGATHLLVFTKNGAVENDVASNCRLVDVYNALYVHSASGSDGGNGTKASPYQTISYAISQAVEGTNINVAAGTYNEAILMKEGVSLYGGYNAANWDDRNNQDRENVTYSTEITGMQSAYANLRCVISTYYSNPKITSQTVLDGFKITAGSGYSGSTGITNYYSSLTITNNTVYGGNAIDFTWGIFNDSTSSIISNNVIDGGTTSNSSVVGISSVNSSATISYNTINAGVSPSGSNAIVNLGSYSTILYNTIDDGTSPLPSWIVNDSGSISIEVGNVLE